MYYVESSSYCFWVFPVVVLYTNRVHIMWKVTAKPKLEFGGRWQPSLDIASTDRPGLLVQIIFPHALIENPYISHETNIYKYKLSFVLGLNVRVAHFLKINIIFINNIYTFIYVYNETKLFKLYESVINLHKRSTT